MSSSPTSTSATDPASGSPTASATAAADLGSQLAQQILRDYNVRNNPAIVASAAGDPTGWKAADTGITLEQDLFGTVDARVNKTLKPASPFDFTPKELIVASPEGAYPRWAVIEFGESERAGGTASPSATASASPADRRVVGVFVQPVADAPWLMENHITVPRPATSVTAREASAAESADARAALQRALDYLTFGREAPEVDLGSIPGSRSSLLIPAKDNIRDTTLVCSTYVPPAGVPGYGNSRAYGVGPGYRGADEHCDAPSLAHLPTDFQADRHPNAGVAGGRHPRSQSRWGRSGASVRAGGVVYDG